MSEAEENRKREAIEAEKREIEEDKVWKQRESEMLRLAAERKPDGVKLAEFADLLDSIVPPPVETDWAKQQLADADAWLNEITAALRGALWVRDDNDDTS